MFYTWVQFSYKKGLHLGAIFIKKNVLHLGAIFLSILFLSIEYYRQFS